MAGDLVIRLWNESDSVSELTALLHRSYKSLADMGLRFLATHQDDETTLDRISTGICYVVEQDGALVGTITLYLPDGKGGTPWYDRSDVARFGQFAIEPKLQKQGIGAKLMDVIEEETANRDIPNSLSILPNQLPILFDTTKSGDTGL